MLPNALNMLTLFSELKFATVIAIIQRRGEVEVHSLERDLTSLTKEEKLALV